MTGLSGSSEGRGAGAREGRDIRTSLAGRLARMGLADVTRAARTIEGLGASGDEGLLTALGTASDPDLALASLALLAERDPKVVRDLSEDYGFRDRLIAALGASSALAGHLARHPADRDILKGHVGAERPGPTAIRAELLRAVGADPLAPEPVAALSRDQGRARDQGGAQQEQSAPRALAAAYHRRLLHLAARDLTGINTIDEVAEELADLAGATLEAALAVARYEMITARGAASPSSASLPRLAVIAMGKCGARELNYASDVDVIFVASDDSDQAGLKAATQLATRMIGVCGEFTPEGTIFPVDPNLRPEGRNGPLVRTLASHLAYYDRWAKTWEFQALLKARPIAGDMALATAYADAVTPLVWQASQRDNFVTDVQAMRRRVESTLPKNMAGREIKLGPGGLRDIEFAVQLLQLVHGRTDETLRAAATLDALAALASGGYVGREDAASLAAAYRFLRSVEHLLQLRRLRRTHTLPEDPAVLRQVRPCFADWGGRCTCCPIPNKAARSRRAASTLAAAPPGPRCNWRAAATRRRRSTRHGESMPCVSAACTRSCSTARCLTRSPGCPRRPHGSRRRQPRPGLRPSATRTRLAPCGTSRR